MQVLPGQPLADQNYWDHISICAFLDLADERASPRYAGPRRWTGSIATVMAIQPARGDIPHAAVHPSTSPVQRRSTSQYFPGAARAGGAPFPSPGADLRHCPPSPPPCSACTRRPRGGRGSRAARGGRRGRRRGRRWSGGMGVTASRCEAAEAAPEVRLGVDGGGRGEGGGGPRLLGVAGTEGALALRGACVGPGLPQACRACATPEEGLVLVVLISPCRYLHSL